MKNLLSIFFTAFIFSYSLAQPNMTLWIAPDGYHSDHNHNASQQYFCDSSYYIFYHPNPDTLFITAKNEGAEPLEISSINTGEIEGASFQVIGFTSQHLLPGEMYTIKVLYQLPGEYINGINGQLSISSDDPDKPNCTLYFDIGCGAFWELSVSPQKGISANCDEPVVYVEDGPFVVSPQMLFGQSMTFYDYDATQDTSFRVMRLSNFGISAYKEFVAHDRFYAGLTGNGSENAFNVDSSGVNVNRYLDVNAKLHVVDILDADNGIACDGTLFVNGNTDLDGALEVTGNATVDGTLTVEVMTNPSDSRLKKDINPIRESLSKMMQLSPKTYFLKSDEKSNHQQYGFLAQELEEVIPEVVHSNSDGMKSVNYMQIIPWLAAALQEQQREIIQLKGEIAKLKK